MIKRNTKPTSGFTIVELLVVIVVIAILAAITIVAFNGLQSRAMHTMVKNDLSRAARTLEAHKAIHSRYPDDAATANNGRGLQMSPRVSSEYSLSGGNYCLTAGLNDVFYYIDSVNKSVMNEGLCPGHVNPNQPAEIIEIVKGSHTASQTGIYQITTDLRPSDLVFVLLHKSASGTAWMNIYGTERAAFYHKSVPVGATEPTMAYAVTGLTGPGEVRMTQALTSSMNKLVIYVVRGLKNPGSVASQEYISTAVTPPGNYSTAPMAIGKKQVAIFSRMLYSGAAQAPLNLTPSGWQDDDTTYFSTYKPTYVAHYIGTESATLQATTTLPSNNYILQVMFVLGDSA